MVHSSSALLNACQLHRIRECFYYFRFEHCIAYLWSRSLFMSL